MTPFKLPDLVLGVSIVADTSGAKKAGRDLQRAVNQGFGGPTSLPQPPRRGAGTSSICSQAEMPVLD